MYVRNHDIALEADNKPWSEIALCHWMYLRKLWSTDIEYLAYWHHRTEQCVFENGSIDLYGISDSVEPTIS